MTKTEFLDELCKQLYRLPQEEIDCARYYYSGVIDGKTEAGMTETAAVEAFGGSERAALEYIKKTHAPEKHKISGKIKAMPPFLRVLFSVLLSVTCFALIGAMWVAAVSVYIVVFVFCACGAVGVLSGIAMCFIRTLPVGLCVTGLGMIGVAVALLLLGPARAIVKIASDLAAFIMKKIRALLAKEALSV